MLTALDYLDDARKHHGFVSSTTNYLRAIEWCKMADVFTRHNGDRSFLLLAGNCYYEIAKEFRNLPSTLHLKEQYIHTSLLDSDKCCREVWQTDTDQQNKIDTLLLTARKCLSFPGYRADSHLAAQLALRELETMISSRGDEVQLTQLTQLQNQL